MNKPTPIPTSSPTKIYYYAKPAFLTGKTSIDWGSLGVTDLLVNPGYVAYLASRPLTPQEIADQLSAAFAIANGTPLTLSLNSTGQMPDGSTKTFNGWDAKTWMLISDNQNLIIAEGKRQGAKGYFLDTELYGPKMPQQVVGLAWPDAAKGVAESRAELWVNNIIKGHPGAIIGMHGFHSWEDQFPSYKHWCAAFGAAVHSGKAQGFFLNEDAFTNNFQHFATSDILKNLQGFYNMPVWPMFQAPTAGTSETNEAFWKRFTDNSPKLFKKAPGCGFYQDDDIFSLHPLQGGIMTRALKSIKG